MNHIHETEEIFLANYRVEDYERPSVATDIVAFSVFTKEEQNYRKLPQQSLNVLLIKRGGHPYKGQWALPGGFVQPQETVDETAQRELEEETGVKDVYMEQLYTFSEVNRDPRTRVISASYMALLNKQPKLQATTDAVQADWFQVKYQLTKEEKTKEGDTTVQKKYYDLELISDEETLSATLCRTKILCGTKLKKEYEIIESKGIAFDHAKIIGFAIDRLRGKMEYTDIAFYLVPELFTLTGLQKIFELVLDKPFITANFRRKMMDKVEETNLIEEGGGFRNAKLFKRKDL